MKNTTVLLLLLCITSTAFSQKAKKTAKAPAKATVLAKAESVSAVLVDIKGAKAMFLLVNKGKKSDSLLVKTIIDKSTTNPENAALKSFTAKGDKLHLLTWAEKSESGDAKSRL